MRNPRMLAAGLLFVLCSGGPAAQRVSGSRWVGSWAASQQVPEPGNALAPELLHDATLRQVVHLSVGGPRIRLLVSNVFGTAPLTIDDVHAARAKSPAAAAVLTGTDRAVLFDGRAAVTIPAGASYLSDPVELAVRERADVTVSIHFADAPAQQTGHPGSRATSYIVPGDRSGDADLPGAPTVEHWYQLAGVEVQAAPGGGAVVTLGDSITDGHGATTNGNDRWPDILAARLQDNPGTRNVAVLNHGIGGNRLLLDGLGPNALARFERDVLAQPGVRWFIVLEGINDLGTLTRDAPVSAGEHQALVRRMIGAYRQMIERAHAHGIKAIGATILADTGNDYYHPDVQNEADRQAVNAWIRAPGHFDAVVDFDKVTRDPAHPDRMRADYDSGDHLHPGPAGYRAMADSIPLGLFAR